MLKPVKIDKAKTHGISFKPSWLYVEARKYGRSLRSKQNASEVVCNFLQEGLITAGWLKEGDDGCISPATLKILAECERQKFDWKGCLSQGLLEHANRTPPRDPASNSPAA